MLRTTDESPQAPLEQVPDHILDQAISWAVRIHAQPATEADRKTLDDWRARSPMHEAAWQSVQSVDRQLGSIPDGAGPLACLALENVSRDRGISRRRMLRITGLAALATGTGLLMKKSPWPAF